MTRTITGLVSVTDPQTGEVTELGEATLEIREPERPIVVIGITGTPYRNLQNRIYGPMSGKGFDAVIADSGEYWHRLGKALARVAEMDLCIPVPPAKSTVPFWSRSFHKRGKGRS